eukprot:CAMPEP_0185313098 /NCGR_PEP_ID=MMETSP1363-20130426/34599_1 /TAXON_ID=38817 /ORGANISM="Gephyrocapsa oceanica, Strain RCC1303" /LENGTH=211 /DNA_ID=CAMNT_0027910985 /DNA_START=174 /DNA_END=810 /DNA_ORIENTATION=+
MAHRWWLKSPVTGCALAVGKHQRLSSDDAVRISARERATDPVWKESFQLQELANVVVRQRVARKLVPWVLVVRDVVRRADKDARQPPGRLLHRREVHQEVVTHHDNNDACRVAREGLSRTSPGPNAEMYAKMNSSGDTARAVDGETDLPPEPMVELVHEEEARHLVKGGMGEVVPQRMKQHYHRYLARVNRSHAPVNAARAVASADEKVWP